MARIDNTTMLHQAMEDDPNETNGYRLKVRDVSGTQGYVSVSSEDYIGKDSTAGDADFVVAYTAATTITISGMPYTPSALDIIAIVQIPTSGSSTIFTDPAKFSYSSGVITVTGAAFASTDKFIVAISGRRAEDVASNAKRTEEINPLSLQYTEGELIDTTNIASAATGNYYPSSLGMGLAGAQKMALQYGLSNTDYPSTLTLEATLDDASTPDFVDISKAALDLTNYTRSNANWAVTSAAASGILLFDVAPFKAIRAKIVHSGATNAHQLHFKEVVL